MRFIVGIFFGLLVLASPFIFIGGELFCPWNPWIDTRTAPGYSENAFDSLRSGMSTNEVIAKLGQPRDIYPDKPNGQIWQYTGDGKCKIGDWAWMSRTVIFSNNVVVQTQKRIFYD